MRIQQDAEDARLERATAAMPEVTGRYDEVLRNSDPGAALWQAAVADARSGFLDDRALYWARLKLLRAWPPGPARERVERQSRGFPLAFPPGEPSVLLTGFDPFRLDADIAQCNPSGVAALALHGGRIAGAKVCTAILPVRFADFDRGMVEQLLTPLFAARPSPLTLALTVSMGRDHFDLERFAGRRRSAETPDNRRVTTSATPQQPLAPPRLAGAEFLEFALPAAAMARASGRWQVRDNRSVETVERAAVVANSLAEIADCTAVAGSGGGFLSNEVAYRSLLLHQRLGCRFPLGHLHTPAVRGYDATMLADMLAQIRRIVAAGVAAS